VVGELAAEVRVAADDDDVPDGAADRRLEGVVHGTAGGVDRGQLAVGGSADRRERATQQQAAV
jgi:hypothetical protein